MKHKLTFNSSIMKAFLPLLTLCLFPITAWATSTSLQISHKGYAPSAITGANLQLKFAIINSSTSQTYWSNDGTGSSGSEPTAAVSVSHENGLYFVQLGNTTLTNMSALTADHFIANQNLALRTWLSTDNGASFTQITPDQTFRAQAFAMRAIHTNDAAMLANTTAGNTGLNILASANSAEVHTALGLGDLATQSASQVNISGGNLVLSALTPTALTITAAANLGGLVWPQQSGSANQFLGSAGNGHLIWLSVTPTLTGANLSGVETLSADWVNTANPWSDAEIADVLTITSGSLDGVAIGATSPSSGAFTTLNASSANLQGVLYPSETSAATGQVLKLFASGGNLYFSNDSSTPVVTTNSITSSMLADASVTAAQVVESSVNAPKLMDGSVGSAIVADGSIASADLASSLAMGNLSISALTVSTSANILGLLYPQASSGTAGQVLVYDAASKSLVFAQASTATASVNISGGSIENTAIGVSSANTAAFTNLTVNGLLNGASNLMVGGNLVVLSSANLGGMMFPVAAGSANQVLVTDGQGQLSFVSANALLSSLTINSATLEGGSWNAVSVGSTVPAAGTFTSLTSSSAPTFASLTSNGNINAAGANITGQTTFGDNSSQDVLHVLAQVQGPASTNNVYVAANLMSSSNIYNLGSAIHPWNQIYTSSVRAQNLASVAGTIAWDVNSDAVQDLTLNSTGLGVGTVPSANLSGAGSANISGGLSVGGSIDYQIQTITASTTLGDTSYALVDTSTANIILTLPSATAQKGKVYNIKKISEDDGYIRLTSASNIDGQPNLLLKNKSGVRPSVELISDGSTWRVTHQYGNKSANQGGYMLVDLTGGPTADHYPITYQSEAPDLAGAGNFTFKSNVMVLKWMPAGVFTMGNTTVGGAAIPEHEVTLTEGLWMGVFEVTQLQWLQVMGSHAQAQTDNTGLTTANPENNVSWNDIRGDSTVYDWPNVTGVSPNTFMGNLQAKTGLQFDLPTEAEWEYACRAGTTTLWSYGSTENGDYMWYITNNTTSGTKEVGGKLPNPWGLYDIHGNVTEWCRDWYGSSYYSTSPSDDPNGVNSGSGRVLRGGYWSNSASSTRSAQRFNNSPANRNISLGFRLSVF
jgi:formylglycine-generating enzyme required for sulfatase activity